MIICGVSSVRRSPGILVASTEQKQSGNVQLDKLHLSGEFGSFSGSHQDSSDASRQSTEPSQKSSLFKHLRSAQASWSGGQIGVSVESRGLGVDASRVNCRGKN